MAKPAFRQRSLQSAAVGLPVGENGDAVANSGQAELANRDIVRPSVKSHTPGHINCEACAGSRGMYVGSISRSMSFSEAADLYLKWRPAPTLTANPALGAQPSNRRRVQFVGKRPLSDYEQKAKALEKFFGDMK